MDPNLQNSITETHEAIKQFANEVMASLISSKNHFDAKSASQMVLYGDQLTRLLPEESMPEWLSIMNHQFARANLSPGSPASKSDLFSKFIGQHLPEIMKPILTPDDVNYNFDRVFDQVREAEEIPATFENLVSKLEEIIAADLVDSRVVQQALERLAALMNRNKHGSLTSILVSLHYGRFVMKAFGGALSANKYLKPMVEAFKEEFAEAEAKVQRAEETIKEEAIRRLTHEERLMAYLEQNGGVDTIAGLITQRSTEETNIA